MKIHFPNSAFLGNIDPFFRKYDPTDENELEVSFNEKWVAAHPIALCMAASLGQLMQQKGKPINCLQSKAPSIKYLARMGLFKYLSPHIEYSILSHEPAGRFIPLSNINNSEELNQFIEDLTPLLHTIPNQADAIKYVISELVRNVLEHANSPTGAMVCAQFLKKTNKVSIAVADCGVGIKETINESHIAPSDGEAIKLAITPGVTGTTSKPGGTEANAGAGLFFVKSIAKINRNFFVVYSGNAMYKLKSSKRKEPILYADPERDEHSFSENLPYWKGTIVGVDISLSTKKSFEELLELIREIYHLDIKDRKKLKRAKFL